MKLTRRSDNSQVQSDYFMWLCDLVRINEPDHSYLNLAKELYKIEFYPIVEHDENRCADGIKLREDYISETGYNPRIDYSCLDKPCSILEMLIALASRMDGIIYNHEYGDQTYSYFWEMITNLKLDIYDDDHYYERGAPIALRSILTKFVDRKYRRDGSGGIFPLKRPKNDQRNTEIWYQMNAYLKENYPI